MSQPFSVLRELGDPTRLRVFLSILGPRKNVSQIVSELGLVQPQVSYHLRKLKDAGLAVEEKDGRWVWYQANWGTDDSDVRDLMELMERWRGEAGPSTSRRPASGSGSRALRRGAGVLSRVADKARKSRRSGKAGPGADDGDRPAVVRPEPPEEEMDDFLL